MPFVIFNVVQKYGQKTMILKVHRSNSDQVSTRDQTVIKFWLWTIFKFGSNLRDKNIFFPSFFNAIIFFFTCQTRFSPDIKAIMCQTV